MLSIFQAVRHPLLRAMMGGLAASCVLTVSSAAVVGIGNLKGERNFYQALAIISAGTGLGAFGGLLLGKKTTEENREDHAVNAPQIWQDWRNFKVIQKVQESQEITSFYLQPQDGQSLPKYLPGQFLTIKLDIPNQAKPIIRTYSLSDYQVEPKFYRLSIKRELAPKGLDVPPGLSSNFMHDQVEVGTIIPAKPPAGKFYLDIQKSIPIVLVSNGVGITPMIAMAKAAAIHSPQRPVWFFHGARDRSFHALNREMVDLANTSPNLQVHYAYSKPRPEDQGHYHSTGYVDMPLIQSLVKTEAEYFLCGSPAFMDSLRTGLSEAGVPSDRVFFEMFTKEKKAAKSVEISPEGSDIQVVFHQSQIEQAWQNDGSSLLEFAENAGLEPNYSCRQGVCGTCECKLLEGEVNYLQTPTASVAEGSVLICISEPKSTKVVLDL